MITDVTLPKQEEFIDDRDTRHLMYSGSYAAGKTRALCMKIRDRAWTPGAFEGLARRHFSTLRATTLRTLLEPTGNLPPVLRPEWIERHHKTDHIIELVTGGIIYYFGMDETQKLGSLNLSGCGIDEVIEVDEERYGMVDGQTRRVVPGLTCQVYSATNPDSPSHHLAARFGVVPGKEPLADHRAIQTCLDDNVILAKTNPEFIESMNRLSGMRYLRYVKGLWVGSDRLVYVQFDRDKHTMIREAPPRKIRIGVDDGSSNPFAALRLEYDSDDAVHVAAEAYGPEMSVSEKIQAVRDLIGEDDCEAVIVDNAAPYLIREMEEAGLPAVPCTKGPNSVVNGCREVGDLIGEDRLTFDPRCVNTIRELESYERRKESEIPVDANNHALDGLRYGVLWDDSNDWDTGWV